jgi:hypothetical protein
MFFVRCKQYEITHMVLVGCITSEMAKVLLWQVRHQGFPTRIVVPKENGSHPHLKADVLANL